MNARIKFLKMFNKLPEKARRELVYMYYNVNPMTLNIVALEIKEETKLGAQILKRLGYEDD